MNERTLNIGITASYTPMLARVYDLMFGDAQDVFARDALGQETHVDRTLNVVASGFQHNKFFSDVDQLILTIFNQLPFEEQPKYVTDMGCGDGTFLKWVYDTIQKSARGKVLDQYPIRMIGVDYNEKALIETSQTLADIPHLVLWGDIGNLQQLVKDLKENHGLKDPENILHIRSFLDHNRPYHQPSDTEKAQQRAALSYQGVYVNAQGDLIPAHEMIQNLVEHLDRWAAISNKHGMIILEVHCLEPEVVYNHLDQSDSFQFDAHHAFSGQHLVEADVFLKVAAEVGLFPESNAFEKYPRTLPFSRITLNNSRFANIFR